MNRKNYEHRVVSAWGLVHLLDKPPKHKCGIYVLFLELVFNSVPVNSRVYRNRVNSRTKGKKSLSFALMFVLNYTVIFAVR